MDVKSIAIPIAFKYIYRGERHGEVELFFSGEPLGQDDVCLLEPGTLLGKNIKKLTRYSGLGSLNCLVPLGVNYVGRYEVPNNEVKFPIGLFQGAPTTASSLERMSFLPCNESQARFMVENGKAVAPFYILIDKTGLLLKGYGQGGWLLTLPAQDYCPRCWHGTGHPVMHVNNRPVREFSQVRWAELFDEL